MGVEHTGDSAGRITLAVLQLVIGVGAVAGGFGLLSDPSGGAVGMSLEMLRGTPFSDFSIPGLVLFAVNGCGSLAGAFLSMTNRARAGDVARALGAFLAAWIGLQVWWIGLVHWLQPLFFGFALVELGLGWRLRRARAAVV